MVAYILATLIIAASLYAHRAHAAYLTTETRALPTTGVEAQTSRALDPSRRYGITISSNHTLRPLLPEWCPRVVSSIHCPPRVLINGRLLPAGSEPYADERPNFYDHERTSRGFYVPELRFSTWGDGKPLAIHLDGDFSDAILAATVTVTDLVWQKAQKEAHAQVVSQVLEKLNREREEHKQMEAAASPVEYLFPLIFGGVMATLLASFGIRRLCAYRHPDPQPSNEPYLFEVLEQQLTGDPPPHQPSDERPPSTTPPAGRRSDPPAVQALERPRHSPEPTSPLGRLFDPYLRIERSHHIQRYGTAVETATRMMSTDAEHTLKQKQVQNDAATKNFEHQANVWLEVSKFDNHVLGEVALYERLREALDRIDALGLPPVEHEHLVQRITQLYEGAVMKEKAP